MVRVNRISVQQISYEVLFCIYYFSFDILKPITANFSSYSTLILFAMALIVMFLFFSKQGLKINRFFIRSSVLILIIFFAFGMDYIFRPNSVLSTYFKNFLIYGFVPLLLLSRVNDYRKVLYCWCMLAVFVGIMFIPDPIMNYRWSGGYMSFGFEEMLPAFAGSVVLVAYFKKKIWSVAAVVFFVELLICANKGSLFTAIVLLIAGGAYFSTNGKFSVKIFSVIAVGGIVIYAMRNVIINAAINLARSLSFSSYSLRTLNMMLGTQSQIIYDARFDIWKIAWEMFKEKPILGYGIGYFVEAYGGYPHNIFLDIMVSFGSIGLIAFIVLLAVSLLKLVKMVNTDKRIFFCVLLLLWGLPMMISLTLWNYAPFWIYFGILFSTGFKYYKSSFDEREMYVSC